MHCELLNTCTGCTLLNESLINQQRSKVKYLTQILSDIKLPLPISIISLGESGIREKGEIVLENNTWGFINSKSKSLIPINECPHWTASLNKYFEEILKINLNINGRGSARIRSQGPNHGIWLDFANLEVKRLLSEETQLLKLMQIGIVEIGQKRKRLVYINGKLKLTDPTFEHWSSTFIPNSEFKLYHSIGDFSQTGRVATQEMGEWISENINSNDTILEFGSGIGTLTLPALSIANSVLSLEFNKLSQSSLNFTLIHFYPDLKSKWQFKVGNFQKAISMDWQKFNCLLINPPRSGMGDFLATMDSVKSRPQKILYMSCFAESFATDALKLKQLEYELSDIKILDQFPQTEHYEILSVWKQKTTI